MVFEHDFNKYPELTNRQLEILRFVSPHPQIIEDFDAVVVKVYDGDTIRVTCNFRDFDFPIRLLDIDSPEMNEGGREARDWLRTKILGQKVRILIDPQHRVEKYGRLLGRIIYNGLDVGQEQLYLGLAEPFQESQGIPTMREVFRGVVVS